MRQLWQNVSNGRVAVVDIPAPRAGKGEILVRVKASVISAGTERMALEFAEKNLIAKAMARPDLVSEVLQKAKREGWAAALDRAWKKLDSEMALGYSNAGVVIDVGEGVCGFRVGDKVACAGGGFAMHSEIARVPSTLAAVVPVGPGTREIAFEEAAFCTVAAIALQGIRLAEVQLGEVVAIVGLGLIGQIAVQLACASGCTVVGMDPSDERCRLAEQMGCSTAVSGKEPMVQAAMQLSRGRGADTILIAAATPSNDPVALAAEIARDRAKVIAVGAVGLSLPRKPYYLKELDFRVSRSYGPGRYDFEYEEKGRDYPIGYVRWTEARNMAAIVSLLATGKLNFLPLITHRFPIDEAANGYELISGRRRESYLGVVIVYPEEPSLARRVDLRFEQHRANRTGEIGVGVIGAGNFARSTLLPAMKTVEGISLGGICTSSGWSARSVGSRMGFRYCATDVAELLNDDTIDAIVICTRHALHARQVIAAMMAGKHVFCEKPLALSENELTAILEVCQCETGKSLLMVGFNRRFAPLAKQLKSFVVDASEPCLMHYRINAGFIPPEHWTQNREEGGGRIVGEVCHFVDFLSFVCGQPVTSISAAVLPNAGRYCDDNLAATLTFADGSVGTLLYSANGDKSLPKERVEVFVQGRVAVLDDFRKLRTLGFGKQRNYKMHWRADKGYRAEWEEFRNAIRNGGPSPIALGQIVNTMLATFSIERAAKCGAPIAVDSESFIARARCKTNESGGR